MANITSVDLSTYTRVGRYDLPEPTRTTAPANSLLAQEVSAVTYNWDTDTLFVVGDGSTSIVQVSKTGQLINSMTLAQGSSPQGTAFYDLEGLTYVGNGKFVFVEERDRQANLFTYTPNTTLDRSGAQTVKLGDTVGNIGLEGITYDPQTGGFIAVKEKDPEGIFQTGINFTTGTATNGSATTVNSTNLFTPGNLNLLDFADVYALSNLPSLNGLPDAGNLLVLSQESGKIVEIDRAGNVLSTLTITADPTDTISVVDQQHEGVTMDRDGNIYVTSENGGGDINRPQLWVYAPTLATGANLAPTAVTLNNALTSIAQNTSTAAPIKVADIAITDDGRGTNNLTVSGADAGFFEITAGALFLKAGTALNATTKASYSATVNVDDPTVGSAPDASKAFTLAVGTAITAPSLIVSEASPWSSGNSPYAADWFELTNTGTTAVDITGWKIDDNSHLFSSAVALRGITSIAAGKSAIFIENTLLTSTDAAINAGFASAWFGTNLPYDLQIGNYGGSGVGLSTGGDEVNIYNAAGTLITGIGFGTSTSGRTFDNGAGLTGSALPVPIVATLSTAGVNGGTLGAVLAGGITETGSPGRIKNNAIATITGASVTSVKEGTNVDGSGKLRAYGSLTVRDADLGENKFNTTVVGASTNLGTLTISDTGAYSYSADNSAVQSLTASQNRVDTFTVKSLDGSASKTIDITIAGVTAGFSGVAAGDATDTSAILWTRTVDAATKQGISNNLTLQLSTDATFATISNTFTTVSDPNRDFTTKVDATGLQTGTKYYYRFQSAPGELSGVGTFKTAPAATIAAPVRFAVSGDADGKWRPYASTVNFGTQNLDFFVFLGDTIYETASGTTAAGNISAATANATSNPGQALADYRRKYLENIQPVSTGLFPSLETLFTSQGNYTTLDNHELGNGQLINGGAPASLATATGNGAKAADGFDVNATGTFINQTVGFQTLEQAYLDYQPIREKIVVAPNDARSNGTTQLYNANQWGKNVIYINTDTRSYRDVRLKLADGSTDDTGARADAANRTLLGATQLAWLKQTLLDAQSNGTPWKFISVSDPIDQINALTPGSLDSGKSWIGGYRAERNELLKFIADNRINNVVFLATDDHQNRINEITYTDNGVVKVLPNAFSVVDGPIGAGGPDAVTDHSFSNLKSLADTLATSEIANGVNPIGLDPKFLGLKNVVREGDPNADTLRQPIDFYSPDTFNFTTFDVSEDGKTLNVNVQGVNSYAANTFPQPSATNPVRSILSFSVDAAKPTYDFSAATFSTTETSNAGFSSNATVRVTRSGDLNVASSVQLNLAGGTATGGAAAPLPGISIGPSNVKSAGDTSATATPYVIPTSSTSGVSTKSILSVGNTVPLTGNSTNSYSVVGIPDGLGAFDNGNGTFTLLMGQEIGSTSGIARAHGGKGAFISSYIINKSDLSVVSGSDLIQQVYGWDAASQASSNTTTATPISFNRFCSADLPAVSAFYNSLTGKGTQERIFLTGEEGGTTGYALATVATGASKGNAYVLGKFNPSTNGSGLNAVGGWENLLANPLTQDKTVVIGNNDGGTGVLSQALAVYVGTKQNTGTEADKAGLTNGVTKFVNVTGNPVEITTANAATRATGITDGTRFTLNATASTAFSRPEDGAWNPSNSNEYFFVTTDRIDQVADGVGTQIGRSRLWRLTFDDITNPDAGGKVDLLLDGTEGQNMFDNLTIDKYGHVLLQEDTGNAIHNAKIWEYDIATDSVKIIAKHDPARFGDVINGVQTAATAPFTVDEESSGIIDVQEILGAGWYLFDTQAHYNISGELVEGGQIQALFNPSTYNSANIDYNNKSINVSFAPGEAFKDVVIPIAGDTTPETSETVNLSLSNPSTGAVVGAIQPTAVLTINNFNTDGNDSFNGTAKDDTINGGIGNDTINAGAGDDRINGNAGDDLLIGGDGNNVLDGGTGNDSLFGGTGNDKLIGGDGDDTLDAAGGGIDTLVGGLGNDVYGIYHSADVIIENAGGGNNDGVWTAVNYTLSENVENMYLVGSVNGTGNNGTNYIVGYGAGNNIINGLGGDDVLIGGDGNDFLDGGTGNDYLNGGTGDDRLIGGDGDDTLDAVGGGIDTLIGGLGNDVYGIYDSADIIVENSGGGDNDTVWTAVSYTLSENVENMYLVGSINGTGNNGNNSIIGYGAGDNIISGLGGDDTLNGGAGNDTIYSGDGNDIVDGGDGNDVLDATGDGFDTLSGGAGDDIYVVYNSFDVVIENAGEGNDTVRTAVNYTLADNIENMTLLGSTNGSGNAGNNLIIGDGVGNNAINGLGGNDTLTGGAGSDAFQFGGAALSAGIAAQLGVDSITDFVKGQDKLFLSNTTFSLLPGLGGSIKASDLATVANDTLVDVSTAKIVYSAGSGNLYFNNNGSSTGFGTNGGQFAILATKPTVLNVSDISIF